MEDTTRPVLDRGQKRAMIVGAGALALSAIGLFLNPGQFFQSYLFAYVFWIGITLGCLAISLLHHLTGGRWGSVVRRLLESATKTLPIMAILFLPILAGMTHLYHWTDVSAVEADAVLKQKAPYLNIPFFIVRTVIYFLVWILLAYLLNKWSKQEDEKNSPGLQSRFQMIGGVGLLLYGLTMSFASVDWMMSLEPHWFSTIYGLLIIAGQVLSALAFVIAVAAVLVSYKPLSEVISPLQFHDLGKLLLAFVMVWAYLAFSQFLIIWSGNLPEEIPWYIHRLQKGWQGIGLVLIVFHFALPFLILLSKSTKRNVRTLQMIAVGILFMRFVDFFWLIAPEFHHEGFGVHILDFLLPVGIGGVWMAYYLHRLKDLPLIPVNDPNLKEVLEHAGA